MRSQMSLSYVGGPEVLADALDEVGPPGAAGVHRALRVGPDHLDPPVGRLLQVAARAADRAAGADARHEVRDPPVGLRPQLGPGLQVVRLGVVHVGVLVGLPAAVDLARQPVGDAVVGVGVVGLDRRRAHHHLRAVGPQHVALVLAHLVGADEHALVALALGDHREPHAGVARRRLDDGAAGLQLARRLRGLDHAQRDPVLHAGARVEVLELGQHGGLDPCGDRPEPHQRGVADEVGDVLDELHGGILPPGGCWGTPPVASGGQVVSSQGGRRRRYRGCIGGGGQRREGAAWASRSRAEFLSALLMCPVCANREPRGTAGALARQAVGGVGAWRQIRRNVWLR